MTHGGAANLCKPVLLYNFVTATKECNDESAIASLHLHTLINLRYRGQLFVPSGVASLLRTTAQRPSFFAGIFMSMGNVGDRSSSVIPPSGYLAGGWVGGWVGGSEGGGGNLTPPFRYRGLVPNPPPLSLSKGLP